MKRFLLSVVFVLAASAVCSAQTFYFPQVAVGTFNGGAWKTTIFLSNAKADTASGVVTLTKSDATAFVSTWVDEMGNVVSNGNTIPFQLGPSQSRRFSSVADIPLTNGFATVTSNSLGVLGNAVFTQLNSSGANCRRSGRANGCSAGQTSGVCGHNKWLHYRCCDRESEQCSVASYSLRAR